MLVKSRQSYFYQILSSSPSGKITFRPKVKIDHITPIVINEMKRWLIDFFTEKPPKKVNKPKTNKIPPISIPKYSKNVKKKINIPKQIKAFLNFMKFIWDSDEDKEVEFSFLIKTDLTNITTDIIDNNHKIILGQ